MKVESFMTKDPVTIETGTTLESAGGQMRDKGVGCLVVLRDGKVAGLVTDRLLATHGFGGKRSGDTAVEDIMIEHPACLEPGDNIFHAVDAMRGANVARRLPVVNGYNELVGIVSISDVAVIAKDLLDAVMLEETHHSLDEARVLTGGKRMVKKIRRPTRKIPLRQETHVTREPTPEGLPTKRGNAPPKD